MICLRFDYLVLYILITVEVVYCGPSRPKSTSNARRWTYCAETGEYIYNMNQPPAKKKDYFTYNTTEESFKIDGVPKCAKHGSYCESIPNYPHQQMEQVLRSNVINKELMESEEFDEDISTRELHSLKSEQVCPSNRLRIVPVAAVNMYNEWKYIVNKKDGPGFRQEVHIETCKLPLPALPCGPTSQNGYSTSCKQRYLYRPLLYFSEDGQVSFDTFKLPSACSCIYVNKNFLFNHRRKIKAKKQEINLILNEMFSNR